MVAEIDGQLLAVAAYQLMDLLERRQPQCRITTLVVRADARRRGLARVRLERIEAVASERGCFGSRSRLRPTERMPPACTWHSDSKSTRDD